MGMLRRRGDGLIAFECGVDCSAGGIVTLGYAASNCELMRSALHWRICRVTVG